MQKLLGQTNEAFLREDIFYPNLILTGHCLGAQPTIRQGSRQQEIISRLLDVLTKTLYWLTQKQIVEALAKIGEAEVNSHLSGLLSKQQLDRDGRESIAAALGTLGDCSVIPHLLPYSLISSLT